MLRIQSDSGHILELDDDTIEIELNNWLLSESDDLPGSYSYPIGFPLSDNNRKFIQHAHLPESRPRELPVKVWVNGIMLRSATLSYKIRKLNASGFLKVDAGELASKIKGLYLYEVLSERVYLYPNLPNDTSPISAKQDTIKAKMKEIALADPGTFPFTFFPVQNIAFGPQEVSDGLTSTPSPSFIVQGMINGWRGNNFIVDTAGKYGRYVVPFLYLTYVIKKVCSYFGYTAVGSFMDNYEVQKWVIYNTQALNTTNSIYQGHYVDTRLHVPYMNVSDFLKSLLSDIGLGIYFDNTKMEARFELFQDMRDDSKTSVDLSKFILSGFENEIPDEKGYTVISNIDDQDEIFKGTDPVSTKIKEGQKEYKCSIGTLKMVRGRNPDGAGTADQMDWLIPYASQKGNLSAGFYLYEKDYFNGGYNHKNQFGLRLLSYHGMQQGSAGKLYPFGSSVSRTFNQAKVGLWSLDASQSDSVYRQLTVPFYSFLSYARRLKYEILVPLAQARNLPLHKIYSTKGENSVMVRFLIESLTINLPGRHGNIPGKASVYLLINQDANPNRVENEAFFIEMIISNERINIIGDRQVSYQDITFRIWADAAKTVPANPTNLNVRYEEYINSTDEFGNTTSVTNNYNVLVSGNEYFLPDMITGDTAQGSTTVYGLTYSSDYTIL